MYRISIYSFLVAVVVLFSSAKIEQEVDKCDTKTLKNDLIQELKPDFKYDSSHITKFIVEDSKQGTEIQVPLFSTEKYRLLFNTAALPVNIDIKIYDKKIGSNNRKLLYSSENEPGKNTFIYEPEYPKTVYIDYILPGNAEIEGTTGCVLFLLGYKIG